MTDTQPWMEWLMNTLREAAWAPLAVFLFYLLGLTLELYERFPPLDIPTHFLGGMAITYFYRAAIRHAQALVGEIPFPIQILFAFTSTGTTAVFWEFYEFIIDFFLNAEMMLGVTNTIVDFFMGLSGALVVSLFYRKHR
ncbi:MAG TPA: hypothetical protein VGK56_06650 [Anaerolineales bacterium]